MPHPNHFFLKTGYFLCFGLSVSSLSRSQSVTGDSSELRMQNSKLYVHYSDRTTVDELIDLKSNGSTNTIMWTSVPRTDDNSIGPPDLSSEQYLMNCAANADIVLVGEPLARNSDFTDTRRFIFSDYTMAVDRVIYSRGPLALAGQTIVVTRPGGIVHYRGYKIIGSVPGFELFHLNEPYVMFLKALPNGTFSVFAEQAFNISAPYVDVYNRGKNTRGKVETKQFLQDVQHAINRVTVRPTR